MQDGTIDFPDKLEQYFRPSREDKKYLRAIALLTLLAVELKGELGLIAVVVVSGLGYIQLADGRVWYVLFVVLPRGWWTTNVQDGYFFRNHSPDGWLARVRSWFTTRVRSPTEDVEIHSINTELATAYQGDDDTDTILIEGDGSDTAMTHLASQLQDNQQLSNMTKRLALVKDLEIGLKWIRSYRPSDVREAINILLENLHPAVLPPPQSENGTQPPHYNSEWAVDVEDILEPSSNSGAGTEEGEPVRTPTLAQFSSLTSEQRDEVLLVMPTLEELAGMTPDERDRVCYENVSRNYEELLHLVLDESSKATTALAITIKRDPSLAKEFKDQARSHDARGLAKVFGKLLRHVFRRRQSMAEDKDERLIVEEIVRVAIEGLELAGVQNPRAMDVRRMHEHFRYAWDVQQDDAYARWAAHNPDLTIPENGRFQWAQDHVRTKDGVLDIDGNYIAVIRATGTPGEADPYTFRSLFAIDVPNLTVATTTLTGASDREVDLMELRIAGREAIKEDAGVWYQKQKTLEREERAQHSLETAYSAKYRVRMNIVFVVLAKDPRLLKKYVKKTVREIHAVDGMRTKRITNPFLLVHWFWAANGIPC